MPTINEAELLEGAAAAAAALRLAWLGLARNQTALLSFLCLTALCCLALGAVPVDSTYYFWVFLACTTLIWMVSAWTVGEMFSLSMSDYPGIRTAARWTLYTSIALSLLFSLILALSGLLRGLHGQDGIYYMLAADRIIVLTLAAIIAGLLCFLSRYPLHLSRNTYTSCSFFSLVFLSQAIADAMDSFAPRLYSITVDTAQALICGVLFAGWALLLKTETARPVRRVSFPDPRESDLLRQLDAMNRLLSRVGRR